MKAKIYQKQCRFCGILVLKKKADQDFTFPVCATCAPLSPKGRIERYEEIVYGRQEKMRKV